MGLKFNDVVWLKCRVSMVGKDYYMIRAVYQFDAKKDSTVFKVSKDFVELALCEGGLKCQFTMETGQPTGKSKNGSARSATA